MNDMFAVTACTGCGKLRIIDLSVMTSECPFCGTSCEHSKARKLYEDSDQTAVRDALAHYSGYIPEKKDNKEKIRNADPHSTMVYRYEHGGTLDEKLAILSEGLTAIFGTFTLDHVREVDPKNAEKLLAAMHDGGFAAEIRPGVYKG